MTQDTSDVQVDALTVIDRLTQRIAQLERDLAVEQAKVITLTNTNNSNSKNE